MGYLPEIPGYKIEDRLGEGGISDVFLATKQDGNITVAIKILEPDLHQDKTLARRFAQEVETISGLDHPNIITIHDHGTLDNTYFMAMEYLKDSLRERLDENPRFANPSQVLTIIKQIASALDYAHQKDVVHRDVKPENIMFRENKPVLVDFGLAKLLKSDSRLTNTGITVGTPAYMSPEQIQGIPLDGRADIYSLGIIFFEMITGDVPYQAMDYISLARKHLVKKVPKLPRKIKKYQELLDSMMAKDRDRRISRGNELVDMIEDLIDPMDNLFPET